MKDKGLWRAVVGKQRAASREWGGVQEDDRLVRASKTMAVTVLRTFCKRYRLKETQTGRRWGGGRVARTLPLLIYPG